MHLHSLCIARNGSAQSKMSRDSPVAGSLKVEDYVVFVLMLVVSTVIGIYYAWSTRKGSSQDFLTGGRKLNMLPVSMSMAAGIMSSITVLSNPAEVYFYGAIFVYFSLPYLLSAVVASEVFLPVFYRLAITSTYEYLEIRFNRVTRLLGTVIYIVQTILWTGIVIYGPAVAFSQVTDMDLWGGIISTGIVCTLYCTLGGMKAVVWTDVFQIGIMIGGYLCVLIKSVIVQGGTFTIISDSQLGGRLNFVDFDINPLRRHTFWTVTIGGTIGWIIVYGTNQAYVQRYISCKSITHARSALFINMLCLCIFLLTSVFTGLCLYSVYKDCDPLTAGRISAPDQLMPYLVMDILAGYPGLPGLFFAAVCSGSLSTVSSSINALAAVTVEDLIKPFTNLSEKHLFWMSKGLSFLFGILCIAMAGLTSFMGGMMQSGVIISGTTGGPLLGLFTLGMLFPFANSKGGLSGLVLGFVASLCVSVGSLIYPPLPAMARRLPLTTDGCNFTSTVTFNWTSTAPPTETSTILTSLVQMSDENPLMETIWHSPSYLYFGPIGAVTTFSIGLIVSLLTGGLRNRVDSRLMLMKEDMTSYHIYTFMKQAVRRGGKFYLTKSEENNAMDLTSRNPT